MRNIQPKAESLEGSESSGNDSEADDLEDLETPISHNSSQFLTWAVASEVLGCLEGCLSAWGCVVGGCLGALEGSRVLGGVLG